MRNLDIDFPAELAAIGAQPFDQDLVWNRMNKGLILGAASGDARRRLGFEAQRPEEEGSRGRGCGSVSTRSGAGQCGGCGSGALAPARVRAHCGHCRSDAGEGFGHRCGFRQRRVQRRQRHVRRSIWRRRIRRNPGLVHSRQRRCRVPCRRRRSPRLPHLLRFLHPRRNGAGPFGPAAPPRRAGPFFFDCVHHALIRALTRAIRGDPPHGGGSAETLRPYRRAARRPVPGALRAALRPAGPGRPRRRIATACLRRSTP